MPQGRDWSWLIEHVQIGFFPPGTRIELPPDEYQQVFGQVVFRWRLDPPVPPEHREFQLMAPDGLVTIAERRSPAQDLRDEDEFHKQRIAKAQAAIEAELKAAGIRVTCSLPRKCDCGAAKTWGPHAHWCSTQPETR